MNEGYSIISSQVRKAADVAESDVIQDCAAEEALELPFQDVPDSEVSSLFAQIISDYIPSKSMFLRLLIFIILLFLPIQSDQNVRPLADYDQREVFEDVNPADNTPSQTEVTLDDKYDTVTEAKSILDSWLQKKTEIDEHGLLFRDDSSSKVS